MRSSTSTIRPSSMWAIRSPKWKTRLSWVTTTTARSGRTAASRSSSMTVRPVSWSSAAVGSSQTSRLGLVDQGPRDRHPLLWPPESWTGRLSTFFPMPSESQHLAGPADRLRPCDQPAITSGIAAFSAAVRAGRRLYCWKTKPMFSARNRVLRAVAHRRDVAAEDRHLALVGVEDAGDHREQRRLAAARGADDQRHLPGVDVPVDARERLDPLVARAEVLGQPADPDGDAGGRRRLVGGSIADRPSVIDVDTSSTFAARIADRHAARRISHGRRSPARARSRAGR